MAVAGKLDEISLAIGEMRGELRSLNRSVATNQEETRSLNHSVTTNREHADQRHEENIDRLDTIAATIAPLVNDVQLIKPQVSELMTWKAHWAAMLGLASIILSGVFTLIWEGILHASEIKAFFVKLFH